MSAYRCRVPGLGMAPGTGKRTVATRGGRWSKRLFGTGPMAAPVPKSPAWNVRIVGRRQAEPGIS